MSSQPPRLLPLLSAALLLSAACGVIQPPRVVYPDAGLPPGADAGTQTDGGAQADGGTQDAGESGPIDAPAETWTYVPLPESRCANGTSTGVAVNLKPDATELVLFLQGGGACWESFACLYGLDGKGTATHLKDTVGEEVVLGEAEQPNFFFDRSEAENPFRNAHFVYVPYCTGDLHAGDNVMTYRDIADQPVPVHHKGAHNVQQLLSRLQTAFPALERIWLAGVSAGGYGATLNWWRVREAFPGVRVDVLSDSAPTIDTSGGQYGTMRSAWALQLPPGCEDCETSLTALLPHYADTVPAPGRYALLAFREDEVIRLFFGYGADTDTYRTRVDALVESLGERQGAYRLDGTQHVMLGMSPLPTTQSGVPLLQWLQDFASDAEGWTHAGP